MQNPAIVIAAYNRADSLQRLLNSISRADYSGFTNVPLVISLDGAKINSTAEQQEAIYAVRDVAEQFVWQYGEKRIIVHEENIGLRKHIISCGDLTAEYGSIIMLEDDLFVSPYFYDYATSAAAFYENDDNIAGISLFLYRFHKYNNVSHFIPQKNGFDTFFIQLPSSLGQLWTKKQWHGFKSYYEVCSEETPEDAKLPDFVKTWPASSWKKYYYRYLVDTDKYFVFPYVGYSSDMGEMGTHMQIENTQLVNPLMLVKTSEFHFAPFYKDGIVYDAYLELLPNFYWAQGFHPYEDFCVDVYGAKQKYLWTNAYWLTTKNYVNPIEQYDIKFPPIENNVLLSMFGEGIGYVKRENVLEEYSEETLQRLTMLYDPRIYWKYWSKGLKTGRDNIYSTRDYRWGKKLLAPIRFIRKILHI